MSSSQEESYFCRSDHYCFIKVPLLINVDYLLFYNVSFSDYEMGQSIQEWTK